LVPSFDILSKVFKWREVQPLHLQHYSYNLTRYLLNHYVCVEPLLLLLLSEDGTLEGGGIVMRTAPGEGGVEAGDSPRVICFIELQRLEGEIGHFELEDENGHWLLFFLHWVEQFTQLLLLQLVEQLPQLNFLLQSPAADPAPIPAEKNVTAVRISGPLKRRKEVAPPISNPNPVFEVKRAIQWSKSSDVLYSVDRFETDPKPDVDFEVIFEFEVDPDVELGVESEVEVESVAEFVEFEDIY